MKPTPRLIAITLIWAVLAAPLVWLTLPYATIGWLLLGVVLLVVSVWDAFMSRQLPAPSAQRITPKALSVQQPNSIDIHIASNTLTSNTLLADHHPGDDLKTGLPRLINPAPEAVTVVRYFYHPSKRGPATFGDIEFYMTSLLKLWSLKKHVSASCTLPVYPDFSAINQARLKASHTESLSGLRRQPRRGEGMEFHQLREYQPGDSLRQIDWKATSRRQTPISREYQDEQNQQIVVMLDGGQRLAMPVGTLTGFDHALNATLAVAWSALKENDKAGAYLFSSYAPRWLTPTHGQQGLNRLINGLYDLHPCDRVGDFTTAAKELLAQQRRRSLIIILTRIHPEDEADLLTAIRLLKRHHLVMLGDILLPEQQRLNHVSQVDFDLALKVAANAQEETRRQALHTRLKRAGALCVSATPQQLGPKINTLYLSLKRSGML